MDSLQRSNFIDKRIRKHLAGHIFTPEITDFLDYKESACFRYFLAEPICKKQQLPVAKGTLGIKKSDILTLFFPGREKEFSLLGYIRHDFNLPYQSEGIPTAIFPQGFRQQVINFPLYMADGSTPNYSPLRITDIVWPATEQDMTTGEPEIEIDNTSDMIRIISPAVGQLTVEWGFCHHGQTETEPKTYPWDYIQLDQLDLVANLSAEEVLEAIISGRAQVSVDGADYTIGIDELKSRLERLQEKNDEELANARFPVLGIG